MKKATEFKAAENWDAARITLINAVELVPERAQGYHELAEVMMHLKNYGKARELYMSAINADPKYREPRLQLSAFLLAANQLEESESHVRRLLEFDPNDADALILSAGISSLRKDYDTARTILTGVLARTPDSPTALAALGDVALAQGKGDEAEELFKKSLTVKPGNTPVQLVLSDLYMRQGRLDEAQSILEKIVSAEPKNASLRYFYGEFLLQRGLNDKALEQYSAMIKTDASRHDARDRMYDFHLFRKEIDQAKALTTELEQHDPNDPGTFYFRGRDAELQGNSEVALQQYLKGLEGLQNFAPVFRRAGILELQQGKVNEGLEHLNQALAISASDIGARLALARHFFSQRDFAQAKDHLNRVLQSFPRQIGANVMKADIALIEGDVKTAETVYNALVASLPENPTGYLKLAFLAEQKKDADQALKQYRKVLEFDRDVFLPASRYTNIFAAKNGVDAAAAEISTLRDQSKSSKGEYSLILATLRLRQAGEKDKVIAESRALIETAIEQSPNLLPAYFALASLDSMSGDMAGAVANYQKLLEKKPTHTATRMLLAMSYERSGNFEEAAKEYARILDYAPRFGPAANNRAWILAEHLNRDLEAALKLAQAAKEELPNSSQAADTLGWVHFKLGSHRAALQYLEEAVDLEQKNSPAGATGRAKNSNPEIMFHVGVVQKELGEKEAARTAFNTAREAAANNPKLIEKIDAALKSL